MYTASEAYYSKQQVSYIISQIKAYLDWFLLFTMQPQANVVVMAQPSQPTVVSNGYQSSDSEKGALIFAMFIMVTTFCCCWWALPCSIPAVIYAKNVSNLTV